jgi:hypothetical protein
MKGTSLGPSDLESPQESALGDTYIIYFKMWQDSPGSFENSPGSFEMDLKTAHARGLSII